MATKWQVSAKLSDKYAESQWQVGKKEERVVGLHDLLWGQRTWIFKSQEEKCLNFYGLNPIQRNLYPPPLHSLKSLQLKPIKFQNKCNSILPIICLIHIFIYDNYVIALQ